MVREGEREREKEKKRERTRGICGWNGVQYLLRWNNTHSSRPLCIDKTKRIPKNVLCELVSLLEYNCISQLDGQPLPTIEVHAKPRPHVCSHWDVLELLKYSRWNNWVLQAKYSHPSNSTHHLLRVYCLDIFSCWNNVQLMLSSFLMWALYSIGYKAPERKKKALMEQVYIPQKEEPRTLQRKEVKWFLTSKRAHVMCHAEKWCLWIGVSGITTSRCQKVD